LSNLLIS